MRRVPVRRRSERAEELHMAFVMARVLTTVSSRINIASLSPSCVAPSSFNTRLPSDSRSVSVRYSSASVRPSEKENVNKSEKLLVSSEEACRSSHHTRAY